MNVLDLFNTVRKYSIKTENKHAEQVNKNLKRLETQHVYMFTDVYERLNNIYEPGTYEDHQEQSGIIRNLHCQIVYDSCLKSKFQKKCFQLSFFTFQYILTYMSQYMYKDQIYAAV